MVVDRARLASVVAVQVDGERVVDGHEVASVVRATLDGKLAPFLGMELRMRENRKNGVGAHDRTLELASENLGERRKAQEGIALVLAVQLRRRRLGI